MMVSLSFLTTNLNLLATTSGCAAVRTHIAGTVSECYVATVAAYGCVCTCSHELFEFQAILCIHTYRCRGHCILWFLCLRGLRRCDAYLGKLLLQCFHFLLV